MEQLKNLRKRIRLNQQEMANKIGVSSSYYHKIENDYRNPSFEFLYKFKNTFPKESIDKIFFSK